MRHFILAACVAVCLSATAQANVPAGKVSFQPQVKGLGCLKPETLAMISELVAKIGPIKITSTCGGRHARNSQHYSGKAIDFRPLAASTRSAVAAAKALASTGGVGSYSNGIVHADVGAREASWYGHKRSSRQVAYAARSSR